jgi:hypothetical protein
MFKVSWIDTGPSGSAVDIAENRINVSRDDVEGRWLLVSFAASQMEKGNIRHSAFSHGQTILERWLSRWLESPLVAQSSQNLLWIPSHGY